MFVTCIFSACSYAIASKLALLDQSDDAAAAETALDMCTTSRL